MRLFNWGDVLVKTGIVIQARMGSTRLSGKILRDLCGKPILYHVVERLKQCKLVDEIIIATSVSKQDDVIAEYCEKNSISFFRGSEEDVLSRYYFAAKEYNLETVVRITSDCPLIDPFIVDKLIQIFNENEYEVVTNINNVDESQRTFPRGLDAEVFTFKCLKHAFENAIERYHREHVTMYIYENFHKIYYFKNEKNLSKYRWTVDTQEDFLFMDEVYKSLFKGKHDFFTDKIVKLMEDQPHLVEINQHIEQKKTKL